MGKCILNMEKYAALARQAAAEGCVLLENENHLLPIHKNAHVAVFGRSAFHYYKSGEGSGGLVNTQYEVGILDALMSCADITIDRDLLNLYTEWLKDNPYKEGDGWGETPWSQDEMPVTPEMLEAAKRSDISIIIIGRTAGEDQDNKNEKGSYLLTDEEARLIAEVCAASSRVVVILNVGNIIDMSWVEMYHPQAVLYAWQGGQEGGNGVLDVLIGKVNPCGKLTDTIAKDIQDYPSTVNFGDPYKNFYQEDIYVGYRYFETFAKGRVAYPFGYGRSYTSFALTATLADVLDNDVKLHVTVQNTGNYPGKEVVQIYGEAPQGVLGKPVRQLVAFQKTSVMQPGSTETFTFTIPKYRLASYDDSGLTGYRYCYILEEGYYRFYVGTDVRSACLADSYFQNFKIVERLQTACAPQEAFQRLKPEKDVSDEKYHIYYETVPTGDPTAVRSAEQISEIAYTSNQGYQLVDVLDGKISMESFLEQISDEDLICMFRGEGMCSPLVTPGTAAAFGGVTEHLRELGIPAVCCADGPSGIRMDCGMRAFSLPNGTLLGCTFNETLVEDLFNQVGKELRLNKIDSLLGPGMNIHRHPLNGRNFEYISEDPFLTGKIAAAQVRAMKTSGISGTVKHFAGNNQEYGRRTVNSVISERALREIYLKGFEIAVKEGPATSIMTTYGAVNGIWTAGSYDLCTRILRNEWGFDGIVMSDWWAEANYSGNAPSRTIKAPMAVAQNDIYMCVRSSLENPEQDDMAAQLATGYLTRGALQRNARNILRFILKSPAILRFAGRLPDETNRSFMLPTIGNVSGPIKSYTANNDTNTLVIDGSELRPKRGRMDVFKLLAAESAQYRVSITAKSDLGILAQLPISIYCDKQLKSMILMQGSEGAVVEHSMPLGQIDGGDHIFSLFYGASGFEIQKLVIRWE